jgi:NAD(P)-dependent dehydrogenase (short-subunit alcohol dehydrogenase family)
MGAKRGEEVMLHPAMAKDNVAVITGGASGIGLAAAVRFAEFGIKMCIADIGDDALKDGRGKDVGGFSRHLVRAKPHLGNELLRSSRFADAADVSLRS